MAKPIPAPEFLTIYQLVRRRGWYFSTQGSTAGTNNLGIGFFYSREEGEQQRTLALLGEKDPEAEFMLFELEVPNPAFSDKKAG